MIADGPGRISIGTSVHAEPALDLVGVAAHAYFRHADLAGGVDGGGMAGELRSRRPLDEEGQRGLGGSLFDARQAPAHQPSVPARS